MDRATPDTALPQWAFIDNRDLVNSRRVPHSAAPVIGIALNKTGKVTPLGAPGCRRDRASRLPPHLSEYGRNLA